MIEPNQGAAPPKPPPRAVSPQIRSLANLIRLKETGGGRKFVLLLGAGASISSGVTPTQRIMQELVDRHGAHLTGDSLDERFDNLWRSASPESRRLFLEPYLTHQPSPGYQQLANLIQQGFFDLAVTFNYDRLVERALQDIGFTDFRVVIRGDTDESQIARLIDEPVAKFTLLKLHGSLASTDSFLFDKSEMWSYPPAINELVAKLTARDLIVCGYAFNDLCVQRAFSSTGGAVVWVNPGGAPLTIRPVLLNRHSQDWAIRGDDGMFDRFASSLAGELLAPAADSPPKPSLNPFKFLAAYEVGDKDWFPGRARLRRDVLTLLAKENRPVLHLIGGPKAGKTSFVRAAVMARLDDAAFEAIYLRCRPDLEKRIVDLAASRQPLAAAPANLAAALGALAAGDGRPVVLFLDQFERVVRSTPDTDAGWRQLLATFQTLGAAAGPRLRLVFVTCDDKEYYKLVLKSDPTSKLVEIEPLSPLRIKVALRFLIKKSGIYFDPRIVEALVGKLAAPPDGGRPFTMAHLQTICYLLATSSCTTWEKYAAQTSSLELENAIDLAIADCDIMNFLEDFPTRGERRLVRSFMRVVPEPSKRLIAKFIKDRFADLLCEAPFPEPMA